MWEVKSPGVRLEWGPKVLVAYETWKGNS